MPTGRRLSKVDEQLEAVEMIRAARAIYNLSYRELASIVDVPESLLCRYANGDLLPSLETIRIIRERLSPMLDLTEVLKRTITIKGRFVDLNNAVFNPYILRLYLRRVKEVFSGFTVTKVLTAATDGIPLSVMASYALNANLAVAKQYRDISADEFYEVSYIVDSPPRKVSLYLPKQLLSRNDQVLIVDDIVRTGRTMDALLDMIRQAGARLIGASVLISLNRDWVRKFAEMGIKVDVILDLSEIGG
ncbi:phosphoribosyltransferase family protein [Vulcanisaeta thermophila]|uniref:phosphoribosyltransferase family protein n=1 Tax=Vulcanisaeta thermophila TaxID=867917 RepID=UPI000852B22E|nr:phosphoribosyltransferase family protein [Vulcanisaeta thermophila]